MDGNEIEHRPQIVILSGNHLCHNPRVIKEASALEQNGIGVTVLGMWFDNNLKARDEKLLQALPFRFLPVLDLTGLSRGTELTKLSCRIRSKFGCLAYRCFGLANRWQLGYGIEALSRKAKTLKADLYIAHSEAGMRVAVDLLARGAKVGLDMEDWFSEDLLLNARKARPVPLLRTLESKLLRHGVHTIAPSQVMSEALADAYNCTPPRTVYNAFPWSERAMLDGKRKDRKDSTLPSIHWYSQSIGHGRGLEDLFKALPFLDCPVEIHLRGQPISGFDAWFREQVPDGWRERVFVHPLVTNEELLSRIAEHDIGFAGEMKYSRNRDLTVTNKILHYLLAGLAVVASDTAGQTEIAEQVPEGVLLYCSGDPQTLAACFNKLLGDIEQLNKAKTAVIRAAEKTFCWERQERFMLNSVRHALKKAMDF